MVISNMLETISISTHFLRDFGTWSRPVDDIAQELAGSRATWGYITAAETRADFKMSCSALDPKTYANNFSNLCIYMEDHYEKAEATYISKYSHFPHLPKEITGWVNHKMRDSHVRFDTQPRPTFKFLSMRRVLTAN